LFKLAACTYAGAVYETQLPFDQLSIPQCGTRRSDVGSAGAVPCPALSFPHCDTALLQAGPRVHLYAAELCSKKLLFFSALILLRHC
jgi:hypothetical protein